jgi:hypothetical protein
MAIGHFGLKDAAKAPYALGADKDAIYFRDTRTAWNHALLIAPSLGWIQYFDESSSAREPVEGVPDDAEVERLALDCLLRLGIDQSLLADKPRSRYPAIQGKLAPDGKRTTRQVFQRGISLVRRIDGILDAGKSFWIHFGSHARIKDFDLVWRNLSPHELRPLASPAEVIALIREGRAVAPMQDFDWAGSLKAARLTITDVRLYYFDRPGMEQLDFTYPYAELQIAAESGQTNTNTFYLLCPILSTNSFDSAQTSKRQLR